MEGDGGIQKKSVLLVSSLAVLEDSEASLFFRFPWSFTLHTLNSTDIRAVRL